MTNNENIVNRVVERIKAQPLGDLITEEDRYEIVKEAIPRAFFEKQTTVQRDGYRNETLVSDPLIVVAMRDALRNQVVEIAKTWFIDNADVVRDLWKKVLEEGMLRYFERVQQEKAMQLVRPAMERLLDEINKDRMQRGQPTLFL